MIFCLVPGLKPCGLIHKCIPNASVNRTTHCTRSQTRAFPSSVLKMESIRQYSMSTCFSGSVYLEIDPFSLKLRQNKNTMAILKRALGIRFFISARIAMSGFVTVYSNCVLRVVNQFHLCVSSFIYMYLFELIRL